MFRLTCAMVLALSVVPALAADRKQEVFTISVDGSITIGADGSVRKVQFVQEAALGKQVAEAYAQQIGHWRFEPVVENGEPVNATGRMKLELVATREQGSSRAALGIRRVWFTDPPSLAGSDDASRRQLMPPRYPGKPLNAGVGGRLDLLVQLDAEGRVRNVATESLVLLGAAPGNKAAAHSAALREAAEKAATGWFIPGYPEGQLLVVPVTFSPYASAAWVQLRPGGVVDPPAWVAAARSQQEVRSLLASGGQVSDRLKLLTPLDDTDGG